MGRIRSAVAGFALGIPIVIIACQSDGPIGLTGSSTLSDSLAQKGLQIAIEKLLQISTNAKTAERSMVQAETC